MLVVNDVKLDYNDVLIVPQRSTLDSRSAVDLLREYKFRHCKQTLRCTGIIASNMWNVGTAAMANALSQNNMLTAINKFASDEELIKIYTTGQLNEKTFITIGQSEGELARIPKIGEACFKMADIHMNRLMICIDVANGYRASFVDFVKRVRDRHDCLIMAGNVTTPEMVQELILAGADIVKIGIGPGSVCETRRVTGVGYPMLSASIECANAAHGLGGHICADGGCKTPGDVCKAFCAGADFVMLGGMLAGTDECQGEWSYKYYSKYNENVPISWDRYINGRNEIRKKHQLKFFGMSSREAMEKFGGADRHYRASEGKTTWIDYKGSASTVIDEVLGGLRSCGTYIGAARLKDFSKCATFIKVC
jgi:GMP reductase